MRGDNYYRHWFLEQIMDWNIKMKSDAQNPIRIDFVLKRARNYKKADRAYYYLFSVQSVKYVPSQNNIDHVALTDKGRNELLGEYYLDKEKNLNAAKFNNMLIVSLNIILIAGVVREYIAWMRPDLFNPKDRLIKMETQQHPKTIDTLRTALDQSSKTQSPTPYKSGAIDSAKVNALPHTR